MKSIYLDHNSTTPVLPEVRQAMEPFGAETFGNAASVHHAGRRARQALENARDHLARLLGAEPEEVLFTSGATEANNLAVFGSLADPPGKIVASPIEHPSVAEPLVQLKKRGFEIRFLPVNNQGIVRVNKLDELLDQDTRLVTVMLANNETGAIQPVRELAEAASAAGIPFHTDAVQAIGKVPVSFEELGVSTLSLSAHKFNGPKGIGALLMRRYARPRALFHGGHQQWSLRPGTEPVALVVGMAKAVELACAELAQRQNRVLHLRSRFLDELNRRATHVVLNGPTKGGLPHTLNLSFPGCQADVLLMKLDLVGVACSTGSACSSGSLLPSPVLQAMGLSHELLTSAMRFSISHLNTDKEMCVAASCIAKAVAALRAEDGESTIGVGPYQPARSK